jgi:hypothetical protein
MALNVPSNRLRRPIFLMSSRVEVRPAQEVDMFLAASGNSFPLNAIKAGISFSALICPFSICAVSVFTSMPMARAMMPTPRPALVN